MPKAYVSRLDDNSRERSIGLLKKNLAISLDLSFAVKQAHWTLKGPSFIGLHELMDQVAMHIREASDMIAERTVILGGQPHGSVQAVSKDTSLDEYPVEITDQSKHVDEVTSRLMAFGASLKEAIDDAGEIGDEDTADLFTEISRTVDKDAWFVGAHNK